MFSNPRQRPSIEHRLCTTQTARRRICRDNRIESDLLDRLRSRLTLQYSNISQLLPFCIHRLEACQDRIGVECSVRLSCPGIVLLCKNNDDQPRTCLSKFFNRPREAIPVAPLQLGILRFRTCFSKNQVDLVICGLLACSNDIIETDMDCDYLGGVGVKEGHLIVEEFVEGDAGDARMLEVVLLWEVGNVFL
jgi:hypothetical protein